MTEQEPLRIEIPIEEESPLKPEVNNASIANTAVDTGRKVVGATADMAQKAANSEAGRAAARKLHELSNRGVRYVGTHMADTAEQSARVTVDAMQQRLKDTDWEKEARSGAAAGLAWLSGRLNDLARHFETDAQEKGPADQDRPDQQ